MRRRANNGGVVITAKQVAYCLKHLQDGTALRRSALTRLPVVTRLAAERYRGSYWGQASALRDVLLETCRRLEAGMEADPGVRRVVTFLKLYTSETSVSQIARQLAVNRTTVYRFIMPDAFALLAEELARHSVPQGATKGS
ncbi:MAG: hypothetical protein FJ014_19310 [Chloroflexi bacterium]|nr:hypothetical protein [Chloroflexota bacterium]